VPWICGDPFCLSVAPVAPVAVNASAFLICAFLRSPVAARRGSAANAFAFFLQFSPEFPFL